MKKLLTIALAAAALVACNKNESEPVVSESGSPIRFTAEIPNNFVFKSTALEGKKVRIVADATLDGATTVATAEGNVLNPETTLRWKVGQTEKTTFAGIYQEVASGDAAAAPADMKVNYNINGDNYAYHAAYLTATAKDVTPEAQVNLAFKHPFTKVAFAIENNLSDAATVKSILVKNVVLDGVIDLAADSINLSEEKKDIAAEKIGDEYTVVIMPQTALPTIVVTVTKDDVDRSYFFTLAQSAEFAANKTYTANIVLDDTVQVGAEVGFAFTLSDWEVVTEPISTVKVSWAVLGIENDINVAMTQTTPGSEPFEGVWEADITYKSGDLFYLAFGSSKEAKMNADWAFYALNDFTAESYLVGEGGKGIVLGTGWDNEKNEAILAADGTYHLVFTYTGYKLVVTAVGE